MIDGCGRIGHGESAFGEYDEGDRSGWGSGSGTQTMGLSCVEVDGVRRDDADGYGCSGAGQSVWDDPGQYYYSFLGRCLPVAGQPYRGL